MNAHDLIDQAGWYEIRVQGLLDESWAECFENLVIFTGIGKDKKKITILTGPQADQAALQGTIQKLYSLGLTLISVARLDQ